MRVKVSRILIVYSALIVLLTLTFPLSQYVRLLTIGMIVFGYMLFSMRKKSIAFTVYIVSSFTFCIWAFLSRLWSVYPTAVFEQLINVFTAILINVLMVLFFVRHSENYDDVEKWLFPVVGLYLIQSLLVGDFDAQQRFSPTGAVNQFGISVSYIYLFSLYSFRRKKYNRVIVGAIIILSLGLVLLSGSRKALVNIVIFTSFVLLFSKYNRNFLRNIGRITVIVLAAIGVIFVVIKVDFLYKLVGKRLVSLWSYYNGQNKEDLSALRRAYMKQDAMILFRNHPIKGIGMNNFKYVARYETYAHSNYYEMLCCLGIVGAFLYYLPILIVTIKSFFHWKKNLPHAVVPLAIFISFLVNEGSNVSYMYRVIHIFLGIGAGMVFVNDKKMRKGNNVSKKAEKSCQGENSLREQGFMQ